MRNAAGLSGVVPGGVVDCWAPLQQALGAGQMIALDDGAVYRLSRPLACRSGGIVGPGRDAAILLFDDPSDTDVGTYGDTCLSIVSPWSDWQCSQDAGYTGAFPSVPLKAGVDIVDGARAVLLANNADAARFRRGDLIQLGAADPADGYGNLNGSRYGVMTTRVLDIRTTSGQAWLALEDESAYYLPATALPRLRYRRCAIDPAYSPAGGVTMSGFTIAAGDGQGNQVNARNRAVGVDISGTEDVTVDGLRVQGLRSRGIQARESRRPIVRHCYLTEILSSRLTLVDGAGDGTGIAVARSLGAVVEGNTIERTAFGIVLTACQDGKVLDNSVSGRGGVWQTLNLPDDPAGNPRLNRTHTDLPDSVNDADGGRPLDGRGIKLQASTVHTIVRGNTVRGVILTGILLYNARYNTVEGNHILWTGIDPSQQAVLVTETISGLGQRNAVRGNLIRGARGVGIEVGASYTQAQGNRLLMGSASGVFLNGAVTGCDVSGNILVSNGGTALVVAGGASGNQSMHNTIDNPAGAIDTTSGAGNRVSAGGNLIAAGSVSLHASDQP